MHERARFVSPIEGRAVHASGHRHRRPPEVAARSEKGRVTAPCQRPAAASGGREAECERYRRRTQSDHGGADEQPGIIGESVEYPAADQRAEGHAEAGEHRRRAEDGADDAWPEIFPRQHGIERHHTAIGTAEDDGERIEFAEPADQEIGRKGCRLHQQAGDQHRLHPDPVGKAAIEQPATQSRQALDAVDADGGHRCDAADRRIVHHVEDRPGMRCAAGCEGQAKHDELRRSKDFRQLRPGAVGRELGSAIDGLDRWAPDEQSGRHQQHPGCDADDQHGRPPFIGRDQPARER